MISDIEKKQFINLFNQIIENVKAEGLEVEVRESLTGDNVDLALDERENTMTWKLKARRDLYIKKINIALEKLENGTFGECEECGGMIEKGRLLARPTATMCIHCKEEQEQSETKIPYQRRSHTLGKEILREITPEELALGIDIAGEIDHKKIRRLERLMIGENRAS
ncbi:MAG: TraR/DksA family transcriptional regulator [Deltaproteobacteria bacterium]|jgi:DnaK suppressor protein|nr:MAG: TraR/DksA family transcriptional regulator [Deltaproteobacteria bacterium]TNF27821.1 MAG: TraR/DksA family transcriptional regulator [Deltaproteobacteria bacterium]